MAHRLVEVGTHSHRYGRPCTGSDDLLERALESSGGLNFQQEPDDFGFRKGDSEEVVCNKLIQARKGRKASHVLWLYHCSHHRWCDGEQASQEPEPSKGDSLHNQGRVDVQEKSYAPAHTMTTPSR